MGPVVLALASPHWMAVDTVPRGGGTICAANDPCWLAQAGVIDCCADLIFGVGVGCVAQAGVVDCSEVDPCCAGFICAVDVGCVETHCLDNDEIPWC